MAEIVNKGQCRGAVAPAEVAVATYAAILFVQLLPERDCVGRRSRRARQRNRLRDTLLVREVGREGRNEVREISDVLIGEIGPGGHRRIGHASPDDVDEILM